MQQRLSEALKEKYDPELPGARLSEWAGRFGSFVKILPDLDNQKLAKEIARNSWSLACEFLPFLDRTEQVGMLKTMTHRVSTIGKDRAPQNGDTPEKTFPRNEKKYKENTPNIQKEFYQVMRKTDNIQYFLHEILSPIKYDDHNLRNNTSYTMRYFMNIGESILDSEHTTWAEGEREEVEKFQRETKILKTISDYNHIHVGPKSTELDFSDANLVELPNFEGRLVRLPDELDFTENRNLKATQAQLENIFKQIGSDCKIYVNFTGITKEQVEQARAAVKDSKISVEDNNFQIAINNNNNSFNDVSISLNNNDIISPKSQKETEKKLESPKDWEHLKVEKLVKCEKKDNNFLFTLEKHSTPYLIVVDGKPSTKMAVAAIEKAAKNKNKTLYFGTSRDGQSLIVSRSNLQKTACCNVL